MADAETKPLKMILVATGSEVSLALEGKKLLEAKGVGTRVVSMPSWELFAEQPQSYREEVLPPSVKARLAIGGGLPLRLAGIRGEAGRYSGYHRLRRFRSRSRRYGTLQLYGGKRCGASRSSLATVKSPEAVAENDQTGKVAPAEISGMINRWRS